MQTTHPPEDAAPTNDLMRAIVQTEYGSTDVLSVQTVPKPTPKADEVLVCIRAASVHAGDWHLMRGEPFLIRLFFGGLVKPKYPTLGTDMAGEVIAIGENVTRFQPGDAVFGDLSESGFGAFAEYVCAPETALVLKPHNLTFEAAATVPVSAIAALQALRDMGNIQPGQRVLVNGASGGVGSFAVQLAKAFGAEVTGVCHAQKVAMVESLGTDHVIDYTQQDVTQMSQTYDLILDAAAYRSVFDFLPILTPQGTYVMVGGSTARFLQVMLLAPWIAKIRQRNVTCLESHPNCEDLHTLKELIEAGKVIPAIDRRYSLAEVPGAIARLEQRQVQGKVVISIQLRYHHS